MSQKPYYIETIENYPKDGKHLECFINLPFQIRKGEDGYYYRDKNGVELTYNIFKTNRIDNRWIVHINGNKPGYNASLEKIFNIMVSKDLDKIVAYCIKVYEKSLELELQRVRLIKAEFEQSK
ncbi:MAG: hypothetical protein WC333_00090 [Dehalococcoidia bacterium]|jgi:hypothetical protein